MAHLLGIDYGRIYLGLAVSRAGIPFAFKVIKTKSDEHKIKEIVKICREENIEKIIIGKGSGKITSYIEGFINKLKERVDQEIIPIDETLTSSRARESMIVERIPKGKRKYKEHAYAAAVLLSLYLKEKEGED